MVGLEPTPPGFVFPGVSLTFIMTTLGEAETNNSCAPLGGASHL